MKDAEIAPLLTVGLLFFTAIVICTALALTTPREMPEEESVGAATGPFVLEQQVPLFPTDATAALFASLDPTSPLRNRFSEAERRTAEAAVHIVCKSKTERVPSISGSGIMVSPEGVVLTNAHVAQFFLLSDYPRKDAVSCSVRTAEGARYKAELLFFPSPWMEAYAHLLKEKAPRATGEFDFAFLYLTEPIDEDAEMPGSFASIPLSKSDWIDVGEVVIALAFPAPDPSAVDTLPLTSTITTVHTLYTFRGETLDLFAVRESSIAERGSSGGAVVNEAGEVVGIIVNRSSEDNPALRDARAITTSHIERTIRATTEAPLATLLSGDMQEKARAFGVSRTASLLDLLLGELSE